MQIPLDSRHVIAVEVFVG